MDITFLTNSVIALALIATGAIFLFDIRSTLRLRARRMELARFVRTLERYDEGLARYRASETPQPEEQSSGEREPPPAIADPGDTPLSRPRANRAQVAKRQRLALAQRDLDRDRARRELIATALSGSSREERRLLVETRLDPTNEESIRAFLRTAREFQERQEKEQGKRSEPIARAR